MLRSVSQVRLFVGDKEAWDGPSAIRLGRRIHAVTSAPTGLRRSRRRLLVRNDHVGSHLMMFITVAAWRVEDNLRDRKDARRSIQREDGRIDRVVRNSDRMDGLTPVKSTRDTRTRPGAV